MKALLPAALICTLLLTACSSNNTSTASDDFPQISTSLVENQPVTEADNLPATESEITLNSETVLVVSSTVIETTPVTSLTVTEITDPVVTERTSAVSFDDILKYYRIEGLSQDAATGEYDQEFDLTRLTDEQEQQVYDYLKNHELTLVGSDTIFDGNEEPDYAFTLKLKQREPVSSSVTGTYRYMNFSSDGKYMKLYGYPNPEIYLLEDTEELQFLYDIDAE